MIIQGDAVMYKINNNQQLQTFRGIRSVYNSEGEDADYTNDANVLNNQLKDQYYKAFTLKTQSKLNTSPFNFSEVQKILESFGPRCDLCNINRPVKDIFCESDHKVYYFYLFLFNFYYLFVFSFVEDVSKRNLLKKRWIKRNQMFIAINVIKLLIVKK
jgi:hypothetical protein